MMRKPKVVILGTGGTIAGRAGSNTEMTGYQAGEIGIQTLINAVPEMLEVADVTGEQFCNIGSFWDYLCFDDTASTAIYGSHGLDWHFWCRFSYISTDADCYYLA